MVGGMSSQLRNGERNVLMDRKKILFLTTQVVVPPTDGGKQGIYYRVRAIAEKQTTLLVMFNHGGTKDALKKSKPYFPDAMNISLIEPFQRDVKGASWYYKIRWGISWLLGGRCRWEKLLSSQHIMDALMFEILENNIGTVVLEGPFAAALLDVPQLKRKHIRIVLVEHNVEYKYFLESLKLPHWIAGLEARRIYSMEKKIVKCADHTICISPQDAHDLQKEFDTTSISYLPSVLPKKEKYWKTNASKTIIFTGGLSFYPNLHGVMWMLKHVWSSFLENYPDYKLVITGKVNDTIKKKLALYPNVECSGFLSEEELERHMIGAQFAVVPIIKGSGVKVKLLEALAYGMPIVTTEECHCGVWTMTKEEAPYMHTSDPQQFLRYMCRMASDVGVRESMGTTARAFFEETFASDANVKQWMYVLNGEEEM